MEEDSESLVKDREGLVKETKPRSPYGPPGSLQSYSLHYLLPFSSAQPQNASSAPRGSICGAKRRYQALTEQHRAARRGRTGAKAFVRQPIA